MLTHPPPALLLDRDGTLNLDKGWVHRPEDFVWIEGAREAVKWANERGILVLVLTNQSGIARGYYSEQQFLDFTAWIERELAAFGAHLDATYYCPHHPTEGRGAYRRECSCRKPAPGLIHRAREEWRFRWTESLMIGDSDTDIQAAVAAGVTPVRFRGGNLRDCVEDAFARMPAISM